MTETYGYDADGCRLRRAGAGVTTVVLDDGYEEDAPSGATRVHYSLGRQLIAQRTSGGVVTYLHIDHLGSVSLRTSASGALLSQQEF